MVFVPASTLSAFIKPHKLQSVTSLLVFPPFVSFRLISFSLPLTLLSFIPYLFLYFSYSSLSLALFILFCVVSSLFSLPSLHQNFSFRFLLFPLPCLLFCFSYSFSFLFLLHHFSYIPWPFILSSTPSALLVCPIYLAFALSTFLFPLFLLYSTFLPFLGYFFSLLFSTFCLPFCTNTSSNLGLVSHRSGTWESVCWCKRLYPAVPGSNSFIKPAGRAARRPPARCLYVGFLRDTPPNKMSPGGTAGPCTCALKTERIYAV